MSAKPKSKAQPYILLAFISGMLAIAAGILLSAYALVYLELPQTLATPMAFVSVCLGVLVSAWHLARNRAANGLACGALVAAIYDFLILGWSFLCNGIPEGASLLCAVCAIATGCIGGYGGLLAAEKRTRRHR